MLQYQTELLNLDVEGLGITIERVTNIDELFERLIAKGDAHEDMLDERIPYWAELWASALAMSQYLVQSKMDWSGKKVLEIGAGLGLPSIVAGKLGATDVTISDYLPEAVVFAEKNWYKNNLHPANFITMDWRNPDIAFAADILLAADIAYEQRMFEFLPLAFKTLSKKGGTILLSEPNRGFAQIFMKKLQHQGFEIEEKVFHISLFGLEQNVNLLIMKVL
jgi:predicted nicotinamide N-methyase